MPNTYIELPTVPEQIGVSLPSSDLRSIDFTALDFDTARRSILEYIRTYYPNDFNDFIASNGIVMIMEIIALTTAKLALRGDILANESTLPTAISAEAVSNHLALIGQRIKRQTPASVYIECTVDSPNFTDILIPARTKLSFNARDGKVVNYELYRSPDDWVNPIVIPSDKRGVIAYAVEGVFNGPLKLISNGDPNILIRLPEPNMLESPVFVDIEFNGSSERWRVVDRPIETYSSNDKVVELYFVGDNAYLKFGDGITGSIPKPGSSINITYRVGGGVRGQIGTGVFDEVRSVTPEPPANTSVVVRFRNLVPSTGGTDKEGISEAKKRAPRDYALQRSIVTASDYAQAAKSFSHPYYGTVKKAIATVRTSLNSNLVEVYVLAEYNSNTPALPSVGLKTGLANYISELNVLTDQVVVLDGALKAVDVQINVVVGKSYDVSVVKSNVEKVIDDYFALDNWELGQPFYVSNLIEAVKSVDGILYLDLINPVDNILPTGLLAGAGDGIGINELISLGSRNINYYYEKTLAK